MPAPPPSPPPPPQHISSRRHKDRAAGKPAKPKFSPYPASQRLHSLQSVSALFTSDGESSLSSSSSSSLFFFPLSGPPDPPEDPEPEQTSGLVPRTSILRGCSGGSHGFAALLLPPPPGLQLQPRPLPGAGPRAAALARGSRTHGSVALPGSVFSLLTGEGWVQNRVRVCRGGEGQVP